MNEHDIRQLASMQSQVQAFRASAIDLASLISTLELLRNGLQDVPQEWLEEFWTKWGVLEEVYSISVVREQPISEADALEIGQAVSDLEAMIAGLLPSNRSG